MSELDRILQLPVKVEKVGLVDKWTRLLGVEGAPPLRFKQAECFEELSLAHPWCGGLFGLDVGAGKTLTGMLTPKVLGAEGRAVYLTPSALVKQTKKLHQEWQQHYPCEPPIVVSYESLSSTKGQRLLYDLDPKVVICDEAHCLANPTTARTGRFMTFAKEKLTQCRFVFMSGSFVKKSVRDFAHLASVALLAGAPLPLEPSTLENWAVVLDWGGEPTAAQLQGLRRLREWAGVVGTGQRPSRHAFRKRLWATPGVVWSSDSSCDQDLTLEPWSMPLSPVVQEAMDELNTQWELPDGTLLVNGAEVYRHQKTMPYGFFLAWDWDAVGGKDEEWDEARKAWSRSVSGYLTYRATRGTDTRFFVEEDARRRELPESMLRVWDAWQAVSDRPEPPTKVVVYAPLQLRILAHELRKLPANTLVWTSTPALAKLLPEFRYHGSGSSGPKAGTCLVSSDVHGTGWDGWHYHQSLVLQPDTGVDWWQQLLGRNHRGGQTKPVRFWVAQITEAQKSNLRKARSKAATSEDVLGQSQKLCSATFIGC